MMEMRQVTYEDIQDYIEGRLRAEDQQRVERFLRRHPIYGARVTPLREQAIRTRGFGAYILQEAIPPEMIDLLRQLPK